MHPSAFHTETIDIVVVTWNSARTIVRCLSALRQHRLPNCKLFVVDNASRDGTPEMLQAFGDETSTVLINPVNRGFAGACNQGARAGEGEAILFLNPDCEMGEGVISALYACLNSAPEVAAVGANLTDPDGKPQRGFAVRSLPRVVDFCCEALLINQVFPRNPWNRRYRLLDQAYDHDSEVEQPAGACFMIKRKAFETIGGFDEQFHPAWFEDVDLCQRLRRNGGKILYCSRATVIHAGGSSVEVMAAGQSSEYFFLNMIRYSKKHFGALWTVGLRFVLSVGMVMRMAALLVAPTVLSRRPMGDAIHSDEVTLSQARRRAYWNILKGAAWQWRP